MMTKHYDYIAIGGGSGGIASVNRAAMYGKMCLIEKLKLVEPASMSAVCLKKSCGMQHILLNQFKNMVLIMALTVKLNLSIGRLWSKIDKLISIVFISPIKIA
jgi:pyruvate/2-oxoglutarate dehydrogenase complex dihydrolipoamide dehydrogenase (E3) component